MSMDMNMSMMSMMMMMRRRMHPAATSRRIAPLDVGLVANTTMCSSFFGQSPRRHGRRPIFPPHHISYATRWCRSFPRYFFFPQKRATERKKRKKIWAGIKYLWAGLVAVFTAGTRTLSRSSAHLVFNIQRRCQLIIA
jgi:hypothetical protein